MGPIPWRALLGMQFTALIRVAGEYTSQPWPGDIAAATLWLLALPLGDPLARNLSHVPARRRDGAPD